MPVLRNYPIKPTRAPADIRDASRNPLAFRTSQKSRGTDVGVRQDSKPFDHSDAGGRRRRDITRAAYSRPAL